MADMDKLYELQKIDVLSNKIGRRLMQLKELLTESDELKTAQAVVEKLEAEHKEWHSQQKEAEAQLETLATRIEESNATLMGGTIQNPKELESLQNSIDAMQRQQSAAETTSVEALYKVEELAEQLSAATAKLTSTQENWVSGQEELSEEETKLKRAYLHLKKQREQLSAEINDELLQRYDQMRRRKGGIAVATLDNDTCSACHVQLPTGILSTVRNQLESDILCPTCGRLLFVPA